MAFQPTYTGGVGSAFAPAADDAATLSALNKTRFGTEDFSADAYLLLQDQIKGLYTPDNEDILRDLEYRGAVIPARTSNVYHYEGGSLFRPVTIAAAVGTSTADSAVITLTADSYNQHGSSNLTGITEGDQVFVIDPDGTGFAHGVITRASHLIGPSFNGLTAADGVAPAHMAEGDYTTGFNATPASARQYTIQRLSGTAFNTAGFIAANTVVSAYSGIIPEGGYLQQEGKMWDFLRFTAQFQQIGVHYEQSDRSANYDYGSIKLNGKTRTWDVQTQMNLKLMRYREAFALFFGPGGSVTLQGKTTPAMKGLVPIVRERGNVYSYVRATGFTQADALAIIANIHAQQGAKSYTLYGGPELITGFQNAVRGLASAVNGSLNYGNLAMGDKVVKFGMDGYNINGVTILFKMSSAFSQKYTTGLAGSPYPGYGVMIPNRSTEGMDADGTPWTNQAFQVRYIPRKNPKTGAETRYVDFETGPETQRRTVNGWDMYTDCTLQVTGAREFYTIVGI